MTQIGAEIIAREMFGDGGVAYLSTRLQDRLEPYKIGIRVNSLIGEDFIAIRGQGKTWDEAVARAKEQVKDQQPSTYLQDSRMKVPPKKKKIRRYITLEKYSRLIETNSLWFARADTLGDPYEGSLPLENLLKRPTEYEQQVRFFKSIGISVKRSLFEYYLAVSESFAKARLNMFISCWQVSDYESESMWKAYTPGDQGVCIESDFLSLKASLISKFYPPISAGLVKYVDFETEEIDSNNPHSVVSTKRKEFESDKELRAILFQPQFGNKSPFEIPRGIQVTVDTRKLIHRVIVNPYANESTLNTLKQICEKHGLTAPVQSKLSNPVRF
ncbi:MAG: DUF2971 domain-containing protein [Meiothermus sp.]|nr:DUF2971 domain-containing protein [Meiothermus sp.]